MATDRKSKCIIVDYWVAVLVGGKWAKSRLNPRHLSCVILKQFQYKLFSTTEISWMIEKCCHIVFEKKKKVLFHSFWDFAFLYRMATRLFCNIFSSQFGKSFLKALWAQRNSWLWAGQQAAPSLIAVLQAHSLCLLSGGLRVGWRLREHATSRVWKNGLRGLIRCQDTQTEGVLCGEKVQTSAVGPVVIRKVSLVSRWKVLHWQIALHDCLQL